MADEISSEEEGLNLIKLVCRKPGLAVATELRLQFQDVLAKNSKLQSEVAALSRDKTRLVSESDALYASKLKLEELCRALQQRNKEASAAAAVAEAAAQREETNSRVSKTVADVQAKLTTYGEEQRAILTENAALREASRVAVERHDSLVAESEALRNQARIAFQLSDLRAQQTTDLTAMHAAEIAELRAHLASARASEEGLKQQLELYRSKLVEIQEVTQRELAAFATFRQDAGRQIERLSAACKAAEMSHNAATVRALEAEIALAQARAEAHDRDAKHSSQVAALSRLPKVLAAERAEVRDSLARAAAIVQAGLCDESAPPAQDGGPVLHLGPAPTAELARLLQVGLPRSGVATVESLPAAVSETSAQVQQGGAGGELAEAPQAAASVGDAGKPDDDQSSDRAEAEELVPASSESCSLGTAAAQEVT